MKNLLFYNKEGYPYNFRYNDNNERYEGKLFFDRNSDDTFKTLAMYIFEEVDKQKVKDKFQYETFRLFDYSGINFIKGNNESYNVKDIKKVNSASNFYSKWVYGDNFNKKFPIGSIISFENLSSDNFDNPTAYKDLEEPFYTVINNRPNAILILTPTSNNNWNFDYNPLSFLKIKSENYIYIKDYSGNITNNINDIKLDPGQIVNVFNTSDSDNNGIYTTNERSNTWTYYNYFDISSGQTENDTLRVDLELLTERPKIYEGNISGEIRDNNNTSSTYPKEAEIKFEGTLNSILSKDDFLNFSTGDKIIFEDFDDNPLFNNNEFLVREIIDEKYYGNFNFNLYKEFNSEKSYFEALENLNSGSWRLDYIGDNPEDENRYPNKYKNYDYFIDIEESEIKTLKLFNSDLYINKDLKIDEKTNAIQFVKNNSYIDNNYYMFTYYEDEDYYLKYDENDNVKIDTYGGKLFSDENYQLVKQKFDKLRNTSKNNNNATGEETYIRSINLGNYETKSVWENSNNTSNFDWNETNNIEYNYLDSYYVEWIANESNSTTETGVLKWTNNFSYPINIKFSGKLYSKYRGSITVVIDNEEVYKLQANGNSSNEETELWQDKTFTVNSNDSIEIIISNGGINIGKSSLRLTDISFYYSPKNPDYGFKKAPELQAILDTIEFYKSDLDLSSSWNFDIQYEWSLDFLKSELITIQDFEALKNIKKQKDIKEIEWYELINNNSFDNGKGWDINGDFQISNGNLNLNYSTGSITRKDIFIEKDKKIIFNLDFKKFSSTDSMKLYFYDYNGNFIQEEDVTELTNENNKKEIILKENCFKFTFEIVSNNDSISINNISFKYLISKEKYATVISIEDYKENLNIDYFSDYVSDLFSDLYLNMERFFKYCSFDIVLGLSDDEHISYKSYVENNKYLSIDNDILKMKLSSKKSNFLDKSTFREVSIPEIPILDVNEKIKLKGSNNKNSNREFKIIDRFFKKFKTRYQIDRKVNSESQVSYDLYQILRPYEINTMICETNFNTNTEFNYSSVTYLTSNKLSLEQEYLETYSNTIDSFIDSYRGNLNNYGIDVYTKSGETNLYFEGIYMYNENHKSLSGTSDFNYDRHFNLNAYYTNNITGDTYISGNTNDEVDIFWIRTYENFSENKIIPIWSEEKGRNHLIEINFNLNNNQQNYGLRLKINSVDKFISFDSNTEQTLNNFVNKHYNDFLNNAINIQSSGKTLYIEGLLPDVYIWDLDITTNYYSSYDIVKNIQNKGIIVESSQLVNEFDGYFGKDFINKTELSTGMIMKVDGNDKTSTGLTFLNDKQFNIIGLLRHRIQLSYQGYIPKFSGLTYDNMISEEIYMGNLELETEKYMRRPRLGSIDSFIQPGGFSRGFSSGFDIRYFEEGDGKDFYYRFRWEEDEGEEQNIFYYDFSGEQPNLIYGPLDDSGNRINSLRYQGPKPLYEDEKANPIVLNSKPNLEKNKVKYPELQQTVFNELEFLLDKRNSRNSQLLPSPIEVFIGYNSPYEGVNKKNLILEVLEYLELSGYTNSLKYETNIEFDLYSGNTEEAYIKYENINFTGTTSGNTNFDFIELGFETGQLISIKFEDQSDLNQVIFENYDIYEIISVSKLEIKISIKNKYFKNFNTKVNENSFYFKIKVEPKEIMKCNILGETEIEDKRFDINLNTLGVQIESEMESLFQKSDIDDEGIDNILLNTKRKEMLLNNREIYDYISSYKSLINSIKFFGYENLELYEYYRNIDPESPMFKKLYRINVEDFLSRDIQGYRKKDEELDSKKFKKTNLFNLTYRITDQDGDYILLFSTDEVQYKLEGVKNWLRENILPLSTNILDITGLAETQENFQITHEVSNQITKFTTSRESSAIDFFIEQSLNFDNNYLVTINWYNIDENFNPENGWSYKIKTFSKDDNGKLIVQQNFEGNKYDLEKFNYNYNRNIDPYIWIQTTYYDENGLGLSEEILKDMRISRNYYLVDNKMIIYKNGPNYLNIINEDEQSYYYYDSDGYIYLTDDVASKKYPDD